VPAAEPTTLLAARAAQGDARAREQLVLRLQPLIAGLAGRFAGRASRADLEQAGMVGVLDALARYDSRIGAFESYATPFAVGEMLKLARTATTPVRVPRSLREAARTVESAIETLTGPDGRGPSLQEIARHTGLDQETVVEAMQSRQAMRALPAEEVPLHQLGATEDQLAAAEDRLELGSRLDRLDERSRRLVGLRFGMGLSQREIATRMGISQMHVSRLLRAALAELEDEPD
jgi:RNA polymerase sigma-B factor